VYTICGSVLAFSRTVVARPHHEESALLAFYTACCSQRHADVLAFLNRLKLAKALQHAGFYVLIRKIRVNTLLLLFQRRYFANNFITVPVYSQAGSYFLSDHVYFLCFVFNLNLLPCCYTA
jgi:hypothetical protein